jgi:AcrR family transcriptional regulator
VARPQTTSAEAILDAVTRLAAVNGPAAATVQAISAATGAPVGSLYHRFESRDALLAQAWLRAAEAFFSEFISAVDDSETIEQGVRAALVTPRWARGNLLSAALIVSHRRQEFMSAGALTAQREAAEALARQLGASVRAFAARIGIADGAGIARCRYALVGIADGAVRMYLPDRAPPRDVDVWVEAAYRGVMSGP